MLSARKKSPASSRGGCAAAVSKDEPLDSKGALAPSSRVYRGTRRRLWRLLRARAWVSCELLNRAFSAPQPHKPGGIHKVRIILKMFHVKHFRPIKSQNLTSLEPALRFDRVRSRNFLVRSESGGSGGSMSKPVAGLQVRCKIHSC